MNNSRLFQIQQQFPNLKFQSEAPLAPYTYIKIGGPAEILWEATDHMDLVSVVRWCGENDIPLTMLGGASNVLVSDLGLRGLVIINRCEKICTVSIEELQNQYPELARLSIKKGVDWVLAETGIKTALFVRFCVDQSLQGVEPFLGVPGTLGGAIFNNAHYTSELIGNFVWAVEVVDRQGNVHWLSQEECQFGYDRSRFHQTDEVILRAIFGLKKGDPAQSMEVIKEATLKRSSTQPLGTANSGCMFKNVELPPERRGEYDGKETLSAGWLIDQAGLKGMRVGGAVVSDKHANFVVNDAQASSDDVIELVKKIQAIIEQKFSVQLQPEVFFLGTHRQWKDNHAEVLD